MERGNAFDASTMITFFIYVLLIQALQILVKYTGQMSLAQGAIYGVGGYTTAVCEAKLHLPMLAAAGGAVVVTAVLGGLLAFPLARLRMHYLAMATLALQVVFSELFTQMLSLTGGGNGLNVPDGLGRVDLLSLVAGCDVILVVVLPRVLTKRSGLAMQAVKTDDVMARSVGISVAVPKAQALVAASALTGLAGFFFATFQMFVAPTDFSLTTSIDILGALILGGTVLGLGPIVGSGVYTLLTAELSSLANYSALIFGVVLVACLEVFPQGMSGFLGVYEGCSAGMRRNRWSSGIVSGVARLTPVLSRRNGRKRAVPQRGGVGVDGSEKDKKPGPVLEVVGVDKRFGGLTVLQDVSLRVDQPGEVLAIIGGNGAGKTTLLNIVTGITPADGGVVRCHGRDITGWRPERGVRVGLARTFQHPRLALDRNCLENIRYGMHVCPEGRTPSSANEHAEKILAFLGLEDIAEARAGSLPYGSRKLLELGRCLAAEPSIMLLDEPAAGLAAAEEDELCERLDALRSRGTSIVVVDHRLRLIFRLADRVVVLASGKVIFEGTPAAARADRAVISGYLGTAGASRAR